MAAKLSHHASRVFVLILSHSVDGVPEESRLLHATLGYDLKVCSVVSIAYIFSVA